MENLKNVAPIEDLSLIHIFIRLSEYKNKMPNLISRRQYNDRRKTTSTLCDTIRKRIAEKIEDVYKRQVDGYFELVQLIGHSRLDGNHGGGAVGR